MTIGTIGTGHMASGLAALWATKGHAIMLGSRDPDGAGRRIMPDRRVQVGTVRDAVAFGNVVLLATPWESAEASLRGAGSFAGKIVVDCTNPFAPGSSDMRMGNAVSGAEEVALWAEGATVFKAFNCISWKHLTAAMSPGPRTQCFYCGEEGEQKAMVTRLVVDAGFEPIDAGPLASARYLEPLAFLWMRLAFDEGLGTDIALTVVRR
jgi:predicted dinucleotide-binding enzyme